MDGPSEAATIRNLIIPALERSGWKSPLRHSEFPITAGQRRVANGRVQKGPRLYADIALLHATGDPGSHHPISVVEAKKTLVSEARGVQQAKNYGHKLGLSLVYATNGKRIIEIDLTGGTQHYVERFKTPEEIWAHYRETRRLNDLGVKLFEAPYSRDVLTDSGAVKEMRYYQHVACQSILQAIASGRRRILAVLATGTGKSFLAAQLVHSLWYCNWPRGAAATDSKPRVLYLADRDVLVSDPLNNEFNPIFGSEAVRAMGRAAMEVRINFASYQTLEVNDLFRAYPKDWFDLIIVDECHRGSARADNAWRAILNHFESAVQLGLTATPRSDLEVDTYGYFDAPVFTYSLSSGINDGFLAPFELKRVALSSDLEGVTIAQGTVDDEGVEIAPGHYGPTAFERLLVLPERTREAARWLTSYLHATDRMSKTIVFCVNQDHAARFVEAIGNLNADLMSEHESIWAARITSDEGDVGKALLGRFQSGDSAIPVVVASSDMLTTGVDAPTVKNVVFFTTVRSISKFKQMIGRGTRLDDERGKAYFTVCDFTGVTSLFADPEFDGPPVQIETTSTDDLPNSSTVVVDEVSELDDDGVAVDHGPTAATVPEPEEGACIDDPDEIALVESQGRRHVLSGVDVTTLGAYAYVVEPGERYQLRAVRIESWARDKVLELGYGEADLRRQWANITSRREMINALTERIPMTLDELATSLGYPEAEPLDLLLLLAFGAPIRTRGERAAKFTRSEKAFLESFAPDARSILETILDKYVEFGPSELEPRVASVPPISELGTVSEISRHFGGAHEFVAALEEVNRRLYEAS